MSCSAFGYLCCSSCPGLLYLLFFTPILSKSSVTTLALRENIKYTGASLERCARITYLVAKSMRRSITLLKQSLGFPVHLVRCVKVRISTMANAPALQLRRQECTASSAAPALACGGGSASARGFLCPERCLLSCCGAAWAVALEGRRITCAHAAALYITLCWLAVERRMVCSSFSTAAFKKRSTTVASAWSLGIIKVAESI